MITQRVLSVLLVAALAASTQACGQSSNPSETPPAPGTAASAPSAAAPAPTTGAAPVATPSPAPVINDNGTTTVTKKLYCPDVSKLKKINMFWGAPGGWRSYSESFVNVVDSFTGAQWVGINVGKMLCTYKSKSTFEFPVVLQNDTLTPEPEGDKWVKQKEGGYSNCISGDLLECPFKFEQEQANDKNIYKELDFFKGKKDYLQDGSVKP